jgi:hypothetical protein
MPEKLITLMKRLERKVDDLESASCPANPMMVEKHVKVMNSLEIILPQFQAQLDKIEKRGDENYADILTMKVVKKTEQRYTYIGSGLIASACAIIAKFL